MAQFTEDGFVICHILATATVLVVVVVVVVYFCLYYGYLVYLLVLKSQFHKRHVKIK